MKKQIINYIGYYVILLGVASYFIVSLYFKRNELGNSLFIGLLFIGFLYGMFKARPLNTDSIFKLDKEVLLNILFVIIGGLIPYILNKHLNVNVVLGSALVGITGGLVIKKYEAALYCGSFIGMCSIEVFNYPEFILVALLTGVLFVLVKDVFNGYGGKLGTTAFIFGFLFYFIFYNNNPNSPSAYTPLQMVIVVVGSSLAAWITYIFNVKFELGPVLASGLVGLGIGVVLVLEGSSFSLHLAGIIFGATFIGMSS
ncbi:MAG: hypothetical protein M0Q00_05180, partial [Acholeplasmataceae bacterium]|nr:hypothetical protein [Acholeplasmataceae bacterium]